MGWIALGFSRSKLDELLRLEHTLGKSNSAGRGDSDPVSRRRSYVVFLFGGRVVLRILLRIWWFNSSRRNLCEGQFLLLDVGRVRRSRGCHGAKRRDVQKQAGAQLVNTESESRYFLSVGERRACQTVSSDVVVYVADLPKQTLRKLAAQGK